MALDPHDDPYAREVIRVVGDLTKRVEEYTRAGDEKRTQFQATIEGIVVQMRKDFHVAITSLQLNQSDHDKAHAADLVDRSNRQTVVDSQFNQIRNWVAGALIGIVLIIGILLGWLVFR